MSEAIQSFEASSVRFAGGKRELTKQLNRRSILDAAREVFGELGYETATVRDIIRRTGLAAGTFYNYYRSKEEVFAALSDEGARRFAPILKARRAESVDFEGFVRGAITAYFEFCADEHENWAAKRPAHEHQPILQGETPERAAVFAEVREAILSAIADRGPTNPDADYMAAACIAIAREIGERMLRRRPVDTKAAADFAVTMILHGLGGLSVSPGFGRAN
ncbi:TetR/AcrR family transcriptional regulator [Phenylobacterium immobile]|uniref:TetR/AcrR family transcriptional regulator n=1 Tax=Phenylobacterium immobile TaxID=21 RepID=UPI000A6A190B|nr:TetR/AcrR family transcriptional regulator [Phenylobacterium immobile]